MKMLSELCKIFKSIFKKERSKEIPTCVIEHLKVREGVRNTVYLDTLGNPTVGVGHLVLPEDKLSLGDTISDSRVEELLQKDALKAYKAACEQAEEIGKLENKEWITILTSVNFQLGTRWIKKFPNTWKHIKNGNYKRAIANLKRSKWYVQTPVRVKDFIGVLKKEI